MKKLFAILIVTLCFTMATYSQDKSNTKSTSPKAKKTKKNKMIVYVDDTLLKVLKKSLVFDLLNFDPHPRSDFEDDSTYFRKQFTKEFPNTLSFPFHVYQMYNEMQADLKLQGLLHGGKIGGVRIYPALKPSTNKLYLVFMGQECEFDHINEQMINHFLLRKSGEPYYIIADNSFQKIEESDKSTVEEDIKAYQSFIKEKLGANTKTSYFFTIEKYYALLNSSLNYGNGRTNQSLGFGLIFYPTLKGRNLNLVAKAYIQKQGEPMNIRRREFYYNHMDACPPNTGCPVNPVE